MSTSSLSDQDWQIRLHIYQYFVEHAHPPTYAETARSFGISAAEARAAYHRLHDAHAIFLDPGTDAIRMAHPLSAIPTPYLVHVASRRLYANCAWDSLGIPAMLHADAQIEAAFTGTGEPTRYAVESGQLTAPDGGVVHYPLPFRHWYDDLIHT